MEVSKAPQSQESKLHFLDYWRIIRIRKAVILAVFLLVVITTAIITQFQPESYSSLARMRVEKDTPLTQLMMGSGPMTPAFDQYFLQTEFQVIRSPKILNEVIKDLKLARVYAERDKQPGELPIQDAYEMLSREVDITQFRNTAIIEITAFNEDRELAARIANKIAEIYGRYRNTNRSGRSDKAWEALTNKLAGYEKEVSEAREKMDKLRIELKVPEEIADSGQVQGLSAQELSRMTGVIQDYQTRITRNNRLLEQLGLLKGDRLLNALVVANPTTELNTLISARNYGFWTQPRLRSRSSGSHQVVLANRQARRAVGRDSPRHLERYALHIGGGEGGDGKPEDLPSGDHRKEFPRYPTVPALHRPAQRI
jgi:succinoglycan biosynthesis transport protein ExoP